MGNKSSKKEFPISYGNLIIYKNGNIIYNYTLVDSKDRVVNILASHLDNELYIIDPIINKYKNNRIDTCEECLINRDSLSVPTRKYFGTSKCKKCDRIKSDIINDIELWRKHIFNMLKEFPNKTVKEYKGYEYDVKFIID